MLNQRNSKTQGDVGLALAIAWFVSNGYTVSIPLTDNQDYDLIVDNRNSNVDNTYPKGLQTVQVKTSNRLNQYGSYEVELRTKGGNKTGTGKTKKFEPSKVDLLFIVTGDGNKHLIPTHTLVKEEIGSICINGSKSGFVVT